MVPDAYVFVSWSYIFGREYITYEGSNCWLLSFMVYQPFIIGIVIRELANGPEDRGSIQVESHQIQKNGS